MSDEKKSADVLLSELKRLRDELALQVHLGKAEAKEEWEKLEREYEVLRERCEPAAGLAEDTARNVVAALGLAAQELKRGYDRFRKLL